MANLLVDKVDINLHGSLSNLPRGDENARASTSRLAGARESLTPLGGGV
jgi:hypothetical protein